MGAYEDLFELPLSKIDFDAVRRFVEAAEDANALTESIVVELKSKRDGNNVAEAVAGLANTDGGLVLVGVDRDAVDDNRFLGISVRDHDSLMSNLHAHLRYAMP